MLQWHDLRALNSFKSSAQVLVAQLAVSPDESRVASVTGQYLPGGEKYEPAPEQEPSVKVFDTKNGEVLHSFSHGPPVLSAAFSPDSRFVAAANMMGEVRVWDLTEGKLQSAWTTPDFTSWGIIKSHHYVGGIFSMTFTPDGSELLVCGMGPMRDPMAGNGKQTWQRFAWRPAQDGRNDDGERGNGLRDDGFHPSRRCFSRLVGWLREMERHFSTHRPAN